MTARVLITGAGAAGSENLVRSLRGTGARLALIGCHSDRFVLKKSSADRNYLIHAPSHPEFLESLRRVIEREGIDVAIPNTDADVAVLAGARDSLPCRWLLPSKSLIERCHDKYELAAFLRARGVPAPETHAVTDRASVDEAWQRLGTPRLAWCRIRAGSGSAGAAPMPSPEQAWGWIRYWEEMRGVPPTAFTVAEYLPGRDFSCQSLWKDGELVLSKTCERLAYFVAGGAPSGTSSVSALAKTVREPRLVEVCAAAIRALDPGASGTFNFDLRENAAGVPCITEINAGRFSSGPGIINWVGTHNMAWAYVRLALGEPVALREEYDTPEDHYMVRDLDTPAGVFSADDLFDGIEDARGGTGE